MQELKFKPWFELLKEIALEEFGYTPEEVETFEAQHYKDLYDSDFTPKEALEQDESTSIDWDD